MSPSSFQLLKRARLLAPAALVLALLLTVLVASAAAPPNVDTFVTPQTTLNATPGSPASGVVSDSGAGEILGSQREVHASVSSGPNNLELIFNGATMQINTGNVTLGYTTLTYDGTANSDPDPSSVDTDGLCPTPATCPDLTQGATTNGFRIVIPTDDTLGNLTVSVWDGVTGNTCTETFPNLFPGNLPSGPTTEYFIEYPTINNGTCTGGPVDFGQVGAVQFVIFGTALDMSVEQIDVAVFDWGDLPENSSTCLVTPRIGYATTDYCQGPRHVVSGAGTLYLGIRIDPSITELGEFDGQPTTAANGDDLDQSDDEDGILVLPGLGCGAPATWCNGPTGGRIQATVSGGSGYLVGWIDFDGDGFETSEVIVSQVVSNAGSPYTFDFTIPAGTFDANGNALLHARFRLFGPGEVNEFSAPYAFDGRDGFGYFTTQTLKNPNQAKNGEVEDYRWIFTGGTLAVTLADLRAEAQSDHVLVSWETVSELDNLGFNLYRSTSPDSLGQQVNPALIPAQAPGSAQGAQYAWQDFAVAAGATYYYTLEDVDFNGATTRHGPVSVAFQAPTAVTLASLAAGTANSPASTALPLAVLPVAGAAALAGVFLRRQRLR